MLTVIGDLLDTKAGIIAHQTNCLGIMGGGLAAKIAKKWPHVEREYRMLCQLTPKSIALLGFVQYIPVSPKLTVANIFSQDGISNTKAMTDYKALLSALYSINEALGGDTSMLHFPYMFGCGLAGGDWTIVMDLIEQSCHDATIVRLPEAPLPVIR